MTDPLTLARSLRRPSLLVTGARLASGDYARERHLPRILRQGSVPAPGEALVRLLDLETDLEQARQRRDAAYSPARHVETLAALMGEARALARRRADAQVNASATSPLRLAI